MCRIIAQIELSTDSTDIQCRRGLGPCRNSSHVDHVVVLLVYFIPRNSDPPNRSRWPTRISPRYVDSNPFTSECI